MSAFTTTQAGNWSSSATWGGGGVPSTTDTWTVNHAVTVDTNVSSEAGTINAALTLAVGVTFTRFDTTTQGNGTFTMGAGSSLILATAPVVNAQTNVKWLIGTAHNQANCKWVINGSGGSHCTISKTGAGYAWIDVGGEGDGSAVNNGGIVSSYCDWIGITNASGMAFGVADFGVMDRTVLYNTFTNCGEMFKSHPYGWSGGTANKNFRVEHSTFASTTRNLVQLSFKNGSAGAGTVACLNNAFDQRVDISTQSADTIDYNYFGNGGAFVGSLGTHNFFRETDGTGTQDSTFLGNISDLYMLADHIDPADRILGINGVGNPHILNTYTQNLVATRIVWEYPHESHVDNGDLIYSSASYPDATTVQNCISLPSLTDDVCCGTMLVMGTNTVNSVFVHNTVVGRSCQGPAVERDLSGRTVVARYESSLIVGFASGTGADGIGNYGHAAVDLLLPHVGYEDKDLIAVSGIKNNAIYYPVPYTDDESGLVHDGWKLRLTGVPDATNHTYTSGSPMFVDVARSAATWAVYKGYIAAAPTRPALPVNHASGPWITWLTWKRNALDAVHTALMADPTLGSGDLYPWVVAGFAPQDTVLKDAGKDGVTIGAVEFSGSGGPPPAPSNVALVSARGATVYIP